MCCRVVAARGLPLAAELVPLLRDETARVRANAARAIGFVGESEQAQELKPLLKDPELEVRRQTGAALGQLAQRLDRPID
jgi:HEAT repeat protein